MTGLEKLVSAVTVGNEEESRTAAEELLRENIDPRNVIAALTEAMREVGKRFESLEIFLPEMMLAATCMSTVMEIFKDKIIASGTKTEDRGVVVIGAPRGDMHEIGKNIVGLMLKANGFKVVDLGPNVDSLDFINAAIERNADVIAISTLMTTTMPGAAEIIQLLKEKSVRDRFKVITGGAPTTEEWAKQIGADGWAPDAAKAVELVEKLLGVRN